MFEVTDSQAEKLSEAEKREVSAMKMRGNRKGKAGAPSLRESVNSFANWQLPIGN